MPQWTLQLRQFGYSSLHLLIRMDRRLPADLVPDYGNLWIEVQVLACAEHPRVLAGFPDLLMDPILRAAVEHRAT
jgi:hypothetical protein